MKDKSYRFHDHPHDLFGLKLKMKKRDSCVNQRGPGNVPVSLCSFHLSTCEKIITYLVKNVSS